MSTAMGMLIMALLLCAGLVWYVQMGHHDHSKKFRH